MPITGVMLAHVRVVLAHVRVMLAHVRVMLANAGADASPPGGDAVPGVLAPARAPRQWPAWLLCGLALATSARGGQAPHCTPVPGWPTGEVAQRWPTREVAHGDHLPSPSCPSLWASILQEWLVARLGGV